MSAGARPSTTDDLTAAVLEHPFLADPGEGTLAQERFQEHLRQDAAHLVGFARALAAAPRPCPPMPPG